LNVFKAPEAKVKPRTALKTIQMTEKADESIATTEKNEILRRKRNQFQHAVDAIREQLAVLQVGGGGSFLDLDLEQKDMTTCNASIDTLSCATWSCKPYLNVFKAPEAKVKPRTALKTIQMAEKADESIATTEKINIINCFILFYILSLQRIHTNRVTRDKSWTVASLVWPGSAYIMNNQPSPTSGAGPQSPGRFIASVTHRLSQPSNNPMPLDRSQENSPAGANGRFAIDSPDYLRTKLFKATKQVFMLEQMVMLLKKSKDRGVASPAKDASADSVRADSIFHQKERLEEIVRSLTAENQALESNLGNAERDKSNLEAAINGSEGDKAELQQKMLDMSTSETVLLKKLGVATDECGQLHTEKAAIQERAQAVEDDLAVGRLRVDELQTQLLILTDENEKLRQEHEKACQEIQRLRQESEKVRQELSAVQMQLVHATAVPSPESAMASNMALLQEFYTLHDPSRVEKIEQILKLYTITELTDALVAKYGEAPAFVDPSAVPTPLAQAVVTQVLATEAEDSVDAEAEEEAAAEAAQVNEDQLKLISLLEEHVETLMKENEDVQNETADLQAKLGISLRREKESKHNEHMALERESELLQEIEELKKGGAAAYDVASEAASPQAAKSKAKTREDDNAEELLKFYQKYDESKASPAHVKKLLEQFEIPQLKAALLAKYGQAPAIEDGSAKEEAVVVNSAGGEPGSWYANKKLLAAVFAGSMVLSGLGGHQLGQLMGQPVCPDLPGTESNDCEQRLGVLQADFATLETRLESLPEQDTDKLVAKIEQVQAESDLTLSDETNTAAEEPVVVDAKDGNADARLLQLEEMHQGALVAKEEEHAAAMAAKADEHEAALAAAVAAAKDESAASAAEGAGSEEAEEPTNHGELLAAKEAEHEAAMANKDREHAAAMQVQEGRLLSQKVLEEHWQRLEKVSTEALGVEAAPVTEASSEPASGDTEEAVAAAVAVAEEKHVAAMAAKADEHEAALAAAVAAAKDESAASAAEGAGDTEAAVAAAVAAAEEKHAAAMIATEEACDGTILAKENEHSEALKQAKEEQASTSATDFNDSTEAREAAAKEHEAAMGVQAAAHEATLKAKEEEVGAAAKDAQQSKEEQEACAASMETKQREYSALLAAKEEAEVLIESKDTHHAAEMASKEEEHAAALRAQAARSTHKGNDPQGDDCDHVPISLVSGIAGLGVGVAMALAMRGTSGSKNNVPAEAKPVFTEHNGKKLVEFYSKHDASKATLENAKKLLTSYSVASLKTALAAKYGVAPELAEIAPASTKTAVKKQEQTATGTPSGLEAQLEAMKQQEANMKQAFERKAAAQAASMQRMVSEHAAAIRKMDSTRAGGEGVATPSGQPKQDERAAEVGLPSTLLLPGCLQLALHLRLCESRSVRRAWCRWMQRAFHRGVALAPLLSRCMNIHGRITRIQIMRAFLRLSQHARAFVYLQSPSPSKRTPSKRSGQVERGNGVDGASIHGSSAKILSTWAKGTQLSVLRNALSGLQTREKFTMQHAFALWRLTAAQTAARSDTQRLTDLLHETQHAAEQASLTLQQQQSESQLLELAKERGLPAQLHDQSAMVRVHSVLCRVRDNNVSEAWASWKVRSGDCVNITFVWCASLMVFFMVAVPILIYVRCHDRAAPSGRWPLAALVRSKSASRKSAPSMRSEDGTCLLSRLACMNAWQPS
jgi:hypothetical protein